MVECAYRNFIREVPHGGGGGDPSRVSGGYTWWLLGPAFTVNFESSLGVNLHVQCVSLSIKPCVTLLMFSWLQDIMIHCRTLYSTASSLYSCSRYIVREHLSCVS